MSMSVSMARFVEQRRRRSPNDRRNERILALGFHQPIISPRFSQSVLLSSGPSADRSRTQAVMMKLTFLTLATMAGASELLPREEQEAMGVVWQGNATTVSSHESVAVPKDKCPPPLLSFFG
mmetsp:Transcript_15235/g.49634  ORF Transcript_15235/g.49634 Transcript_15235/m.49634 type:complete len:122 (+) Transcript_15235:1065-1430(+)